MGHSRMNSGKSGKSLRSFLKFNTQGSMIAPVVSATIKSAKKLTYLHSQKHLQLHLLDK